MVLGCIGKQLSTGHASDKACFATKMLLNDFWAGLLNFIFIMFVFLRQCGVQLLLFSSNVFQSFLKFARQRWKKNGQMFFTGCICLNNGASLQNRARRIVSTCERWLRLTMKSLSKRTEAMSPGHCCHVPEVLVVLPRFGRQCPIPEH